MILEKLYKSKIINPPSWLPSNCNYLAIVGSESYGANIVGSSDTDIQGFCMPPKDQIFPHLGGEIPGFGTQQVRFDCWQQHHCIDVSNNNEYDFAVYSIVKFFNLAMQNNPNILDIISVPSNCITHITHVGQMVRDNRHLFYNTGCFPKFRGYAMAQIAKLKNGNNRQNSKRAADIARHGYDTKYLMHIVRLALECEQLLLTGQLDLTRDSQTLLSVRRGEWTLDDGMKWWVSKERDLETAYTNCKVLPHSPDEAAVKTLLINCMEQHYGDLSTAVSRNVNVDAMAREIRSVLDRYVV